MHDELYPEQFEWDAGNQGKNLKKHDVNDEECEEIFFDEHKKILKDTLHSETEDRFILIGKTVAGRVLFVAYTLRTNKIRIISARNCNKKEQKLYE